MGFKSTYLQLKAAIGHFWDFTPDLKKVSYKLLLISCLIPLGDIFFVYALQAFLSDLGILADDSQNFLLTGPLVVWAVILASGLKNVLLGIKEFYAGVGNQQFAMQQRVSVLRQIFFSNVSDSSFKSISQFTEETNKATNVFTSINIQLSSLIMVLFFTIACLYKAPGEFLFACILLLIIWQTFKLLRLPISGKELTDTWGKLSGSIIDGVRNAFYLKVSNTEKKEFEKAQGLLQNYFNLYRKYYVFYSVRLFLLPFMVVLVIILICYLGINYFGTARESLLGFLYLFMRLGSSASEFINALTNFKLYEDSYLGVKSDCKLNERKKILLKHPPFLSICLENLTYVLNGKKLYNNLNCVFSRGDRVIIKGPSGSGKSTLIKLLIGFINDYEGKVLIDGKEVKTNEVNLLDQVAYAGSDAFLLEGSVRENIIYGAEREVSDSEVDYALKQSTVEHFLKEKELGLEHEVKASGDFSAGQIQRIGLSRLFLKRNPSLVILDEATANLDVDTEEIVVRNLFEHFSEAIFIIVSHRDSLNKYTNKQLNLVS